MKQKFLGSILSGFQRISGGSKGKTGTNRSGLILDESTPIFLKWFFLQENLLIQRPLRYGTSVFLCWIPACCGCKRKNLLSKKITVHFKLNLKTDGLICKMIFKFWKHIERFHSARKQCVCLYKHHLRCKMLVGNTQTLERHPVDSGCFIAIFKNSADRNGIFAICSLRMLLVH